MSNILKVSVIIPLYNHGETVKRAVESALVQPETEEVIVVDDGSEDQGPEIVAALAGKEPTVRLLSHRRGESKGVSASRNVGAKAAKSPWLAFLDADDYMLPERFRRTKALLDEFPDADGVCEALGSELDGSITMVKREVSPDKLFFEMAPFGGEGHFSVCALTVSAHAFRETGGFAERLAVGEDTEWLARLVLTHQIRVGSTIRPVAMRGRSEHPKRHPDAEIQAHKTKMAAMLLQWATSKGMGDQVIETLVNLFLKYHYEQNRILSTHSKLTKKRNDFAALRSLLSTDRRLIRFPGVRYFTRTVLGLPVREHFDYYRATRKD